MGKRFALLMLSFLVLVTGGCSVSLSEEEAVASERVEKIPAVKLPVVVDYIPKLNFVPTSEGQTHVVLHFISNAAANPENPYVYEEIRKIFVDYNVSPHYMIDREGKIYALLPENRAARHAGKGEVTQYPAYNDHLNRYSIGIELMAIGTEEEMKPILSAEKYEQIPKEHIGYTEAQYRSLNRLLDDLLARHKRIKKDREHIIGHDEYAPGRKTDPGELFDWEKVNW